MTHIQQARQALAKCQSVIDEARLGPDYYQAIELAKTHAQIAQAEALTRLAECAETLIEMHIPEPFDSLLDAVMVTETELPPQRVIFLDIDGVLTNAKTGYRQGDANCVNWLNTITDQTGAVIVVSSTWRADPEIANVLARQGVTGEVIGTTPFLDERNASGLWRPKPRGCEIQAWLDANPGPRQFVILDDDNDMGDLTPRLVQTQSEFGLRREEAKRAIAMLLEAPQ